MFFNQPQCNYPEFLCTVGKDPGFWNLVGCCIIIAGVYAALRISAWIFAGLILLLAAATKP